MTAHAAQSTGREYPDASEIGDLARSSDCDRRKTFAGRNSAEIADTGFNDVVLGRHLLRPILTQADMATNFSHCDSGRDRAPWANRLFDLHWDT